MASSQSGWRAANTASFKETATQLGIKVAGRDSWDPKAANYKALVTKMRALSPWARRISPGSTSRI